MNKEQFYYNIAQVHVFDAHTHLLAGKLRASSFWEIVHYFWFLRELQGGGYPPDYEDLPEDTRIDAFLSAFHRTKGTGMHYVVNRIFRDLYDCSISDKASVYKAIDAVSTSALREGWEKIVMQRGNIVSTVVNRAEDRKFVVLPEAAVFVPRVDGRLQTLAQELYDSGAGLDAAEKKAETFTEEIRAYAGSGACGIMTTLPPLGSNTVQIPQKLESISDCTQYLLHALCGTAQECGLTVQLFLGVETETYASMALPVNRYDRILNLYGLFERYKCRFDLVVASEGNNMDCVQAAHIFPHVHVGGMWWFNFRPSTYTEAMARRFEVLAANKSYLSISDSRCIEWCYGKNALIKKLAADFLSKKVEEGYITYEDALQIADEWLYKAAARLYTPEQARRRISN